MGANRVRSLFLLKAYFIRLSALLFNIWIFNVAFLLPVWFGTFMTISGSQTRRTCYIQFRMQERGSDGCCPQMQSASTRERAPVVGVQVRDSASSLETADC